MTSTGCSTAVPVYIGKLLEYIPFSLTFYHIKEIKIDKGSTNVYKSIDSILKKEERYSRVPRLSDTRYSAKA